MTRYAPDYDPTLNPYLGGGYGYKPPPQPIGPMAGSGGGFEAYRFIRPPGAQPRREPPPGGFLARMNPNNGIYGDYLNRLAITGRLIQPQMSGQFAGGGT